MVASRHREATGPTEGPSCYDFSFSHNVGGSLLAEWTALNPEIRSVLQVRDLPAFSVQ